MPISTLVPSHLVVGARTGFLTALQSATALPYQRIAQTITMGAKSLELADLGGAPMPTKNRGRAQVQEFVEKKLTIKPVDWDITVSLSHDAMMDDQTGELERKVRAAGENFNKHLNNIAFGVLDDGDTAAATSIYGMGYDGLPLFDDAHIDKGGQYQTGQDNKYAVALSLDQMMVLKTAANKTLDDQGEPCGYNYDLLVVPPDLEYLAFNICNNPQALDTASREANAFAGRMSYIVSPKLNTTAYMLVASNESTKPVIIAMREQPNLQSAWFDPNGPDGGLYYFKFFARYNAFPGDWRTAYMGNT